MLSIRAYSIICAFVSKKTKEIIVVLLSHTSCRHFLSVQCLTMCDFVLPCHVSHDVCAFFAQAVHENKVLVMSQKKIQKMAQDTKLSEVIYTTDICTVFACF